MRKLLLLTGCFLILSTNRGNVVFGQATDGNLTGTVQDATGASVSSADVQLLNQATGIMRAAKTDANGFYRFQNIPIGQYKLSASAPGFESVALQNLDVALNKSTTANLTLQIGAVTTQVEVRDAPALIDTTTSQIASTFESRQTLDMPAASLPLGVLNLSLLSAGVTSSGGLGTGEGPSVGGQRPRNNNFNIEGVDNNAKDTTGRNVFVPNEAVAQVTILQNQYSAEFGHSTGGQFNTIVKGGTNTVHGSIYEYFQNRHLNRDFHFGLPDGHSIHQTACAEAGFL